MSGISPPPRVSFGEFELTPATGELRKSGIRIKLHAKPFQILLTLLEHPGEVTTRKELQERLWPAQTFMEFENGLNNAVRRLREALGDTAKNPRFIETIPRHGYRFLAEPSPIITTAPAGSSVKRWTLIYGLSAAAVILIVVVFYFAHPPSQAVHSLAVLPFKELGKVPTDGYFAAGMTDAVTTDLAKLDFSKVVPDSSAARFKSTKETDAQIARALGVDAVVRGRIFQDGDHIRITVQLVRADSDRDIWADNYVNQTKNLLSLQDQVAQSIATGIADTLSPGTARVATTQ